MIKDGEFPREDKCQVYQMLSHSLTLSLSLSLSFSLSLFLSLHPFLPLFALR